MSRILVATALVLSFASAGVAFAQGTPTSPNTTATTKGNSGSNESTGSMSGGPMSNSGTGTTSGSMGHGHEHWFRKRRN